MCRIDERTSWTESERSARRNGITSSGIDRAARKLLAAKHFAIWPAAFLSRCDSAAARGRAATRFAAAAGGGPTDFGAARRAAIRAARRARRPDAQGYRPRPLGDRIRDLRSGAAVASALFLPRRRPQRERACR